LAASFFMCAKAESGFIVVAIDEDSFVNSVKTCCHEPQAGHDQDKSEKREERVSFNKSKYADSRIANPEPLTATLLFLACAARGETVNLVADYKERD
jgi:hypothetical protein